MKQYLDPLQQEAHDAFFIIGRDGPEEVFPPNVQKADFIKALAQLREICGPENVVAGKDLVNFVDPFAVNVCHIPSAAVWYVIPILLQKGLVGISLTGEQPGECPRNSTNLGSL
jgi:hypothetical protein